MTSNLLAIFGIGTTELVIVAVIILILFGSRLPQVMGSLGTGIKQFKKGLNDPSDDDYDDSVKKP
jgi:sec-independent protein translocase protein TatA